MRRAAREPVRVRLLVLPPAGTGPASLRPLVTGLPDDVEVMGLNLPGRERRRGEPPGAGLADVLASLRQPHDRGRLPTVVYGHRLGALLAPLVAAELDDECRAVVLSDFPAAADDRRTFAAEAEMSGVGPAGTALLSQELLAADPAERQALLPVLRADLTLAAAASEALRAVRLTAPVTVLTGPDHAQSAVDALRDRVCGPVELLAEPHGGHGTSSVDRPVTLAALRWTTDRVERVRGIGILCLPFAGGGAGFFRSWSRRAPTGHTVRGLQLPGRENRILEEAVTDVRAAAECLLPQVATAIDDCGKVVLFGHSLGAALGFELALLINRRWPGALGHLYASGSTAPHCGRTDHATGLDDDAFVARVRGFAGHHDAALDDPELRELLLPTLRTDVAMHEAYRAEPGVQLDTPITVLRGQHDELVSAAEAARWAEVAAGPITSVELTGGHMYLLDQAEAVLAVIAGTAAAVPHAEGKAT
ncbi:thioesterase II family protein [Micromonospora haikouensis]|uniref:thioesterase II family protein n=1 Tax=Micromonospora haikouensis TaxID=686309 RepID=UPI00159F34BD|nr:alpha/beta fold hydrolase [Micromonospora haikouensis]